MKNNKGFTIIELVITIFILSVAVVGVYNAFSTMVVLTANASNRLIAAYLAQEGIELVRNIRDTNWTNDYDWRCGLANLTGTTKTCTVGNKDCTITTGTGCQADYKTMGTATSSQLTPYGVNGDYLRTDSDGFYSYSTGTDTKFKRKIIITPMGSPDNYIMKVRVEVFWDEKASILNPAGQGSITAEENLYDWY